MVKYHDVPPTSNKTEQVTSGNHDVSDSDLTINKETVRDRSYDVSDMAGDEDNDEDANKMSTGLIVMILAVMTMNLEVATNIKAMEVGHSSSKFTRSHQVWMNGRGEINKLQQKGIPNNQVFSTEVG